jgi:hypothetical protein
MGEYEFRASEGDEKHHHTSGETFAMNELDAAEQRFSTTPGFERIPSAHKALFLRNLGIASLQSGVSPTHESVSPSPAYVQKKELQQAVRKKLGRLVFLCQEKGIVLPAGVNPYQAINNAWGRAKKYSNDSTNDELGEKLKWLEDLIARVLKGDKSVLSVLR